MVPTNSMVQRVLQPMKYLLILISLNIGARMAYTSLPHAAGHEDYDNHNSKSASVLVNIQHKLPYLRSPKQAEGYNKSPVTAHEHGESSAIELSHLNDQSYEMAGRSHRYSVPRKPVPSSMSPVANKHSTYEDRHEKATPSYSVIEDTDQRSYSSSTIVDDSQKTHSSFEGTPPTPDWTPVFLRQAYLLSVGIFALCILGTVVVLHIWSFRKSGIGVDDGSITATFAWRFAPTLVAVVYSFCLMVILEDVKRTEGFARLAQPGGWVAESSLFFKPGPWWATLVDSFPSTRKRRTWRRTSLFAVIAHIMGFLIISPLSSTLLEPRDTIVSVSEKLVGTTFDPSHPLQLSLNALSTFNTIGNILQNATTSMWIGDEFAVLPVWGNTINETLPTNFPPLSDGTWQTNSIVLKSELECERFDSARGPTYVNYTQFATDNSSKISNQGLVGTITLESESGCAYSFAYDNLTNQLSKDWRGGFWGLASNAGRSYTGAPDFAFPQKFPESVFAYFNMTSSCDGAEVILALSEYRLDRGGHLCRQQFQWADVAISIVRTTTSNHIEIDKKSFDMQKQVIPQTMINTDAFQQAFLNSTWEQHLAYSKTSDPRRILKGPMILLGAEYQFSIQAMADDSTLIANAARIKQRAFGEAVIQQLTTLPQKITTGEHAWTTRRIHIVDVAAYVIEIVFILQIFLLIGVWSSSRPRIRPLGLAADPSLTSTVASQLGHSRSCAADLAGLGPLSNPENERQFYDSTARLSSGILSLRHSTEPQLPVQQRGVKSVKPYNQQQQLPFVLHIGWLSSLACLTSLVFAATVILYWYADKHGLYQSAFVYRTQLMLGKFHIASFSPYSIIPTFFAVTIGLWYGAVENELRIAQPTLSMASGIRRSDDGVNLSYRSSYLLAAAAKALKHRHFVLAVVSSGAFLSQILTIAMSALLQRESSTLRSERVLPQSLQLRQIPHLLQVTDSLKVSSYDNHYGAIARSLFDDLQSNWLYGAPIQLILNGTSPTWSDDEWSFVPFDLGALASDAQSDSDDSLVATNISCRTPAIRARLDCTEVDTSQINWLTYVESSDSTLWNSSQQQLFTHGYQLGCNDSQASVGGQLMGTYINLEPNMTSGNSCESLDSGTPFFPTGARITCCGGGNATPVSPVTIGYWTSNDRNLIRDQKYIDVVGNGNMTVKWIHGEAQDNVFDIKGNQHLIFASKPSMSALNCRPVIETAKAQIKVNAATGQVLESVLLTTPATFDFPWQDPGTVRKAAVADRANVSSYDNNFNVTASFGQLFQRVLLKSASLKYMGTCAFTGTCSQEDLSDRTFNIRQPGLNVDFMSYSMLSLVGNDHEALLDPVRLAAAASRVYTTYFQHFASYNTSTSGTGGWAYQRINATIPSDVPPPWDPQYPAPTIAFSSSEHTDPTITVTIERPVEMLRISLTAAWLSISILIWLMATVVCMALLEKRYFSPLLRGVNSIGDVAFMVAGSERFLSLARDRSPKELCEADFSTKLGWFRTEKGELRWGIEVVDGLEDTVSNKEIASLMHERHVSHTNT